MGVDYGGNGLVANSVLLAEHVVYGDDAFARGGVGQHAPSGNVSAGPEARHIGLAQLGGLHALGSEIDAQFFETQPSTTGARPVALRMQSAEARDSAPPTAW